MAICSICQNVNKTTVDAALMEGRSVRVVAAQFDLSKSAVARHRTGCLAPLLAAAKKAVAPAAEVRAEVDRAKAITSGAVTPSHQDIISLTGLLERLARSLGRLETAADTAAAGELHVPLATLSSQLHRGIEAAAKIQGFYADAQTEGQPRLTVNIALPPGFAPTETILSATPIAQHSNAMLIGPQANSARQVGTGSLASTVSETDQ